jgi:hypothetical protein
MRKRVTQSGVTVNAIAGSRVVTLGLDISAAKRKVDARDEDLRKHRAPPGPR